MIIIKLNICSVALANFSHPVPLHGHINLHQIHLFQAQNGGNRFYGDVYSCMSKSVCLHQTRYSCNDDWTTSHEPFSCLLFPSQHPLPVDCRGSAWPPGRKSCSRLGAPVSTPLTPLQVFHPYQSLASTTQQSYPYYLL
jgi:hypothetical protein